MSVRKRKDWVSGGVVFGDKTLQASAFADDQNPHRLSIATDPQWNDVYPLVWVTPSGLTDNTDATNIENALNQNPNTSVALIPGATYNINRPIVVIQHGAYLVNPFVFEGRRLGDQPVSSTPQCPLVQPTATWNNNTNGGTLLTWGNSTDNVVWLSGGLIGIEVTGVDAGHTRFANYGVENHNVHSFRLFGNTFENALQWQVHFDSNVSGGTSNHKVFGNLFRASFGTGQAHGAGFFGDGIGWGQSWYTENFHSANLGYDIYAVGNGNNFYTDNLFEVITAGDNTPTGSSSGLLGTHMVVLENGSLITGNTGSLGTDYHFIWVAGNYNTVLGNVIIGNLNTGSHADGSGIVLGDGGNRSDNYVMSNNIRDYSGTLVNGITVNLGANSFRNYVQHNACSGFTAKALNIVSAPSGALFHIPGYGNGVDNRSGLSANDGSAITVYAVPAGTGQLCRITANIFETTAGTGTQTYTITWTENSVTKTLVVSVAAGLNAYATGTDLINPDPSTNITGQLTGIAGGAVVKIAAVVEPLA